MLNKGIVMCILLNNQSVVDGKWISCYVLLKLDGKIDLVGVSLTNMVVYMLNSSLVFLCRS